MRTMKVAINGAGRIGRAFFKLARNHPGIEIVAMNDLGDIDNIAYLLKYDTAYGAGQFQVKVKADKKALIVDDKEIEFLSEKNPSDLPWKYLNVDIMIESSGAFTSYKKAKGHIEAGAKRVIITAPAKDEPVDETQGTVLMGINEEKLKTCTITSNASCTTNAGSPLIQILHEAIGIEKAILDTIHALTASQSIVDGPNKSN